MSNLEQLGSEITHLRTIRNITQSELAGRAGMTQTEISRIERGKHAARSASLMRIAQGLNMKLGFIEL